MEEKRGWRMEKIRKTEGRSGLFRSLLGNPTQLQEWFGQQGDLIYGRGTKDLKGEWNRSQRLWMFMKERSDFSMGIGIQLRIRVSSFMFPLKNVFQPGPLNQCLFWWSNHVHREARKTSSDKGATELRKVSLRRIFQWKLMGEDGLP